MLHIHQFPEEIRKNYIIDSLSAILGGLFAGLVLTFTAVTVRRLEASELIVAFVALGNLISNSTTLFWAYISTRGDKVLWAVIPLIFSRSMLLFCFFTEDPLYLSVILFIYYFSEAVYITPYSSVMKEIYPDEFRSQAMGYVRLLYIAATLTGAATGGRLLDLGGLYGYRWVFPAGGLIGVLAALVFARIKLPSKERSMKTVRPGSVNQSVKNILTSNILMYVFLIEFIVGLANLLGIGIYPLVQVDLLKLSNTNVGLLGVFASLGGITFLYMWGRFYRGKVKFEAFKRILSIVPFILLLYAVAPNIYPLLLASFLAGVCWNGWDILWFNYLVQSTGDDETAKGYVGVRYTMMGIRSLVTPLIISYIGDIKMVLIIAVIISTAGIILSISLKDETVSREFRKNE